MNARKAKDMDGFRCNVCNHFFWDDNMKEYFSEHPEETKPSAEQAAEDCCRCNSCSGPAEKNRFYCLPCSWYSWFGAVWSNIGACYKLGISNEVVWEIVYDELDYGKYMHALETELGRHEYYQEPGTTAYCGKCKKLCTHGQGLIKLDSATFHVNCVNINL